MIRRATAADIDAIMRFVPMMRSQAVFPYDMQKLVPVLTQTVLDGRAFVAIQNSEVVGTAGYGIGEPFWVSSQKGLLDLWVVVSEPHRRGFAAGKLIAELRKEARRLGVAFLPGVSGSQTNAKTYERHYGPPVAVLYRAGD